MKVSKLSDIKLETIHNLDLVISKNGKGTFIELDFFIELVKKYKEKEIIEKILEKYLEL